MSLYYTINITATFVSPTPSNIPVTFIGTMTTDLAGHITNLTYTGAPANVSITPVTPDPAIGALFNNLYDPAADPFIDIFIPFTPNTGFGNILTYDAGRTPPANFTTLFLNISSSNIAGTTITSFNQNGPAEGLENTLYISDEFIIQVVVTNICFPAKTPVMLDQGMINIEEIDPSIHTINDKPIVAVTQSKSSKDFLVCFDKDALGENMPSQDTLVSGEHKILFDGHMIKAKQFIYYFENVYKVKYDGEMLYNVLLDDYSKMSVNNLTVETLHPNSPIAHLYNGKEEKDIPKQAIEKVMNKMVMTKKNESSSQMNKKMYMFLTR